MKKNEELIRESIIRDMSEGVMTIGFGGDILSVNPAAARILGLDAEELEGQLFAQYFFEYPENDAFCQTILDAVYDTSTSHRTVVPYFNGSRTLQLHVTTSYLFNDARRVGVVVVLSDISELVELRDAVTAMDRIKKLNGQLELRNKLLSETFGRFLSDEIVRELLDTPDGLALGGKKKMVTVMITDLRGFTAMSERTDAQDLLTLLNHYLGIMTDLIERRSGTIIEFLGDGILAIFGAPIMSTHHAEDAVTAAVEMQARMKEINRWNQERDYPKLEMGIGIHTGEVIVGTVGSEIRSKYGVIGKHVNLCGRIESYTVGGQILISPQTRRLITCPLDVVRELSTYPKGAMAPLLLSDVTGINGIRCTPHEEPALPLPRPRPISFCEIRDKHSGLQPSQGQLLALSGTGALLKTDAPLELFDDLQLEGELFCKVTARSPDGWILRFTSVPTGFETWLDQCFHPPV